MSPLFLIFALVPLVAAGEGDHISCVQQGEDLTICSNGTEITQVTGSKNFLVLNLENYSSIAPNALKDVRTYSLTLNLGDPSTCEPRDFGFTPESFSVICDGLPTLEISCWNVPKDSNALDLCSKLIKVTLTKSGLTEVPKTLVKNLSLMDTFRVKGHRIKTLGNDAFSGFPTNLRVLDIHDGSLESIEGSPFKNLGEVRLFSLKNNGINDLSPGIFDNLVKVRKMSLEGNQLEKIKKNVFTSALTDLRGLDLSNNRIKDVEDGAFDDVPITGLQLIGNPLENQEVTRWGLGEKVKVTFN
uniref:LRRCT domain-containing protein n=1 Tax=Bracon brevicornis TaxID=1563983 RepID=A0A6V7ILT6_9HYME